MIFCSGCDPERSLQSFGGPTMGSHYSVVYTQGRGQPDSHALHREVDAILAEVDQQMSLWRTDSDIAQFNTLPANSCQKMPAPVLDMVRLGDYLSRESSGAFDVTIEPLMELWGFGPDSWPKDPPTRKQLDETRAKVDYRGLRVDDQRLCKTAAVRVDLNSIAAGYAVDRIGQRLEALGVRDYLVQVTGELKTRGRKPDGSAWRVTLELPHNEHQAMQEVFALHDNSVSTASDHAVFFGGARHQASRTLDALTGKPISHDLASVTVIHPSALMADGLSSLLLILGPERAWKYSQEHKIAAFFVIRADKRFIIRTNASFDLLTSEGPL
ncbi:thiamine biosynthesis protein ApbE [Pseudomonas floridensis]|uniref:FAD:protein FMN transferase n=2 Tax=Pseudomonas floridensis TaxID=1958950 RepID=A0A1X0MZV5_9PSED|nr:thiamine biosynthesis protein ApbE [Pseudomonas floridensis]